jgi:hypothetical protein
MFNEFQNLIGLEKCKNNCEDILSLEGKYHNIQCEISVRAVIGENATPSFYLVACFYLNHYNISYSKVNPRKILKREGKGQYLLERKRYFRERNLLISMIELMNCQDFLIGSPLYQIEIEGNQLIGYFNVIDDNIQTILDCLNFLVNLARKIDWNLNFPRKNG